MIGSPTNSYNPNKGNGHFTPSLNPSRQGREEKAPPS